jgi:hypothetical protein
MAKEMVGVANDVGQVAASALYIRVPPDTSGDWCTGLTKVRPRGMNTPSQCTWSLSSVEVPGRGWLVSVDWAYMLVMFRGMVLRHIIAEIFSPRVPGYVNIVVAGLVRDPKVSHLHRTGPLSFYGVIGDSHCRVVVTVDGCGRLRVPHLFKNESENFDFLCI